MLKSIPQNITGKKTFLRSNNSELYFNSIDFKAPVNNMHLPELFRNQVSHLLCLLHISFKVMF